MVALEPDDSNADDRGKKVQREMRDNGIILNFNSPVASFRLFPPCIVTKKQLDMALESLDYSLASTMGSLQTGELTTEK